MAPDTHPARLEADQAEQLALKAAVAEARAGGPGIPHAVVRGRMLAMVREARQRIEALQRDAAEQPNREA